MKAIITLAIPTSHVGARRFWSGAEWVRDVSQARVYRTALAAAKEAARIAITWGATTQVITNHGCSTERLALVCSPEMKGQR